MARYIGPKCKRERYIGTDLMLKSRLRAPESKCKMDVPPGMHGGKRARRSEFANQLRAKQRLRFTYGVLEKQFLSYYKTAARRKGSTGETLLQILEARLDNIVYRMGFASTRAEARQLVSHKLILVNGKVVNIPSYQVAPEDVIEIRERAKTHARILAALSLAEGAEPCEWVDVNAKKMVGQFKRLPTQSDLPADYNVQLVVELYSK